MPFTTTGRSRYPSGVGLLDERLFGTVVSAREPNLGVPGGGGSDRPW